MALSSDAWRWKFQTLSSFWQTLSFKFLSSFSIRLQSLLWLLWWLRMRFWAAGWMSLCFSYLLGLWVCSLVHWLLWLERLRLPWWPCLLDYSSHWPSFVQLFGQLKDHQSFFITSPTYYPSRVQLAPFDRCSIVDGPCHILKSMLDFSPWSFGSLFAVSYWLLLVK